MYKGPSVFGLQVLFYIHLNAFCSKTLGNVYENSWSLFILHEQVVYLT